VHPAFQHLRLRTNSCPWLDLGEAYWLGQPPSQSGLWFEWPEECMWVGPPAMCPLGPGPGKVLPGLRNSWAVRSVFPVRCSRWVGGEASRNLDMLSLAIMAEERSLPCLV